MIVIPYYMKLESQRKDLQEKPLEMSEAEQKKLLAKEGATSQEHRCWSCEI